MENNCEIDLIRQAIRKILMEDFRYEYNRSDFIPTSDVIGTAKRALEVVNRVKLVSNGGNEGSGLQKAKSLAAGKPLNHEQLKRMKAFFDKNLQAVKMERTAGKDIYSSDLIQKWELWGGDAAQRWVNHEIHTTQNTNKTSKALRPKGTKRLMDPHNTRTHKANHFFNEAFIGDDGQLIDFELRNAFESILDKYNIDVNSGSIIGHNIFRYYFPAEAKEDLIKLGFNVDIEIITFFLES